MWSETEALQSYITASSCMEQCSRGIWFILVCEQAYQTADSIWYYTSFKLYIDKHPDFSAIAHSIGVRRFYYFEKTKRKIVEVYFWCRLHWSHSVIRKKIKMFIKKHSNTFASAVRFVKGDVLFYRLFFMSAGSHLLVMLPKCSFYYSPPL